MYIIIIIQHSTCRVYQNTSIYHNTEQRIVVHHNTTQTYSCDPVGLCHAPVGIAEVQTYRPQLTQVR